MVFYLLINLPMSRQKLQKLITDLDRFNPYKGGVRVGFININDMYNNDVGKGGVYANEVIIIK
jgi:hypothetical protein